MSFNFESIIYSLKLKKTINNPENALQAPLQFVGGVPVTAKWIKHAQEAK
jgi:hypothetical protein